MILRRVIAHFRKQEWTAIALDFLIVVAGVLLAFQITAWGERRAQIQLLDGQLATAQIEMRENLDRLAAADAYLTKQANQMAALRKLLKAPDTDMPEEQINSLIWSAIPVYGIHMRQNAVQALQSSATFAESAAPALIDQLERWEEALSTLNRQQQDSLANRNNFLNPYVIEHLPTGSIVRQSPGAAEAVAESWFAIDRGALAQDKVFDSLIAARQIGVVQDRTSVDTLARNTRRIIELIDDERGRK